MLPKANRWLAVFGAFLMLPGCETAPSVEKGEGFREIVVGKNLVGESCRAQPMPSASMPAAMESALNVYCGRWEHPSGRVFQVGDTATPVEQWVTDSWWRKELDRQMRCTAQEESAILGDVNALLLDCQLNNGGWPYMALLVRLDGSTFLADGIPATFPAIETTIRIASGRVEQGTEETGAVRSPAISRIEASLKGRAYAGGDLKVYYDLMALGQYYNGIKDFPTAERQYREALAIHERLLGVGNPETADPMMHLALALSNQERFVQAEALFQRLETLVVRTADEADYARFLSYRAYHAANQGHFEEALALAQQTTELRKALVSTTAQQAPIAGLAYGGADPGLRATGSDILSVGGATPKAADVVQSLYLEAAMNTRLGKLEESERALQDARIVLYSSQQAPIVWEPQLVGLSGRIAEERGDTEQAGQSLRAAATMWEQRAPGERPTAIAYFELGKSHRRDGRIDEALDAFRKGIALIQSRGGSVRVDQIAPYFDMALETAQAQPGRRNGLYAEMFEAAQLVRSGATSNNIAMAAARLADTEEGVGQIIRELQDAQDDRSLAEREYEAEAAGFDEPGKEQRLEAITTRIVEINQHIQNLSSEVQAASPGYNQLIDTAATADGVFALLRPDEALVQVLLGNRASYVFFVRRGRVTAYALNLSPEGAAAIVDHLREAFQQKRDGTYPPFDVAAAHELYDQLFSAAAEQMEGVGHLVTVPSGSLLSLPFGLLVTEPAPPIRQQDYTQVKWLAGQTAISLVPSVRSFVDLRAVAQPSRAPNSFIGFGDFVPYTKDSIAQSESALPEECRSDRERIEKYIRLVGSLDALKWTNTEVKLVAGMFPERSRKVLLNTDFTRQSVEASPLHDYRIVYFATHALLPSEIDCQPEPSLLASLPSGDGDAADGFVRLSEILKLRLNADLVVLSACNTGGRGLESGGESLSGLARAFFFAGARSLLVSHWAVADAPTAIIMISLFQNLRDDQELSVADALRQAQLRIIEVAQRPGRRYLSHPLYWAAFTLVGDGGGKLAII